MSIVTAEGYTLPKVGWAINLFLVDPKDPLFFTQPDRIKRFRRKLLGHMKERTQAIEQQSLTSAMPERPRSRRRIRVRVDQDLSSQYTVFEVFGWDRIGLLQDLAYVFYQHNCNIWLARIHTEGQRVSDVFYAEDSRGGKITDPERLAGIRSDLLEAVQE